MAKAEIAILITFDLLELIFFLRSSIPVTPKAIRTIPMKYPKTIAVSPAIIRIPCITQPAEVRRVRFLKKDAANGGIRKSATTREATSAMVLVNASGRNSFPSAPTIVKTGRKLIMVVSTAVIIAPETSAVALYTISFVVKYFRSLS